MGGGTCWCWRLAVGREMGEDDGERCVLAAPLVAAALLPFKPACLAAPVGVRDKHSKQIADPISSDPSALDDSIIEIIDDSEERKEVIFYSLKKRE